MSQCAISLRISPPHSAFVISIAFYFVVWLLAPLQYSYGGTGMAPVYVAFCVLVFFGALVIGFGSMRARGSAIAIDVIKANRLAMALAFMGGGGFVLKMLERVLLRGGGQLGTDFVENRGLLIEGGSGSLAFAGSLLGAVLVLLPIVVFALQAAGERGWKLRIMLLLSLAYPLSDLLLMGSRSALVGFLGTTLVAAVLFRRVRLTWAGLVSLSVFAIAVTWIMGYVFWLRTAQAGVDPVASMYQSGYSTFVPIRDDTAAELMQTGASGLGSLKYAVVHSSQYLTHGLYELFYAIEGGYGGETRGLQTFYIPSKIVVDGIMGVEIEPIISQGQARPGVFTTLLGPIYYDYGIYGCVLACVLFGWGCGRISRNAASRSGVWIFLHVVVLGLLLFASVMNLFVASSGQYLLLATIAVFVLMRVERFRAFETIAMQPSNPRREPK
ncbi:hypothetical protein N790_07080 [Arenimonas malthae CC-JY-1]|uniref:Oligosaccharide repeat unit polymerase n=1 Tax=Arenimonas malthae CC-JY-1 TaxID=1384054 RepID=A0A091BUA9_9GAMM|nr:oligosaccharide repeat unit polymerase [Arenimonas malthae]KFN47905.1 hypothetical protein N790_07080 [Arenimonas malthae CC-JY-1]